MKSARVQLALVSVALYVLCLWLPAAKAENHTFSGVYFLISGPFGMPDGEFRWLGNCFYFVGLVGALFEKRSKEWCITSSLIALAIGVSCIVFPPHVVAGAGTYATLNTSLETGGYVWVASQAVAFIANCFRNDKNAVRQEHAA